MKRSVLGAAIAVCICLSSCMAAGAATVMTYDSWYVEISNVMEYRNCPAIGQWVVEGFVPDIFPIHCGTTTSCITPMLVDDGAKLVFDFSHGYASIDQDYSWASPTVTICGDLIYREVFDWKSYVGADAAPYLRLELWAYAPANDFTPQMVWSTMPGSGLRSGHADVDLTSYDYIRYRVAFTSVPEPSTMITMLAGFSGAGFALRRRLSGRQRKD